MTKPQVLVFIDWYKPFFKAGGPVRSLVNLVDHLHDHIDLYIVTGDRDYTADASPQDLVADRWVELDSGERVWYASTSKRNKGHWRMLLAERKWDAIYINGLYSTRSTILPLWLLRGSKQRRIVAVRGMLAAGPMRQSALKKRMFLALMKKLGCFDGVEFQATNAEEVEDIEHWIDPKATIHLVPNLGRKSATSGALPTDKVPGELRLVSVARIAEEKNTLFAIQRMSGLQGDVQLDLYGAVYDQAYWQRCQSAIGALPNNVRVHWHDHIEQDQVSSVLAASHALFMPSVGENFGHTMLEALVAGRPLLISDRTPWKDLETQHAGWDLSLDDPKAFVQVLQHLVAMDQQHMDLWFEGAYRLGERYLNDPATVQRSLALFAP